MSITHPMPCPASPTGSNDVPAISVVICTYNRADLLPAAIEHVLAQDDAETPTFELLVIDNNSTDTTRATIHRAAARDPRVHYLFEPKQGLSHARNAGIAAARAPIITFTDDDVRVGHGWLAAITRTFRAYPGASVVGGKVLPVWPSAPPPWLTAAHWSPLALVDHGDRPVRVDADNPLCLVGANLAVARNVFDVIGGFAPEVQRVQDSVGSSEDDEFLLRLFRAGYFGVYDPQIVIHAAVQRDRLECAYHRRWHTGHGHFQAVMRPEYLERSRAGRLFDVPAHMYRAAALDAVEWVKAALGRHEAQAFEREMRLRFFTGFFTTRWKQFRRLPRRERRLQWRELAQRLVRRRHGATGPPTVTDGVHR